MLNEYFSELDLYTPCLGLSNSNLTVYNEYVHIHAKLLFKILKDFNLEFYVFAGTSIGYLRNKSNIPWVDDYDIMIFEKDIDFFEKIIIPYLIKVGFYLKPVEKPCQSAGYHILSKRTKKYFQCDVFYSKIHRVKAKNGFTYDFVKNLNGWGRYDKKKLTYNMIYPPKILKIDGLELPFFNKIEEDIKIEYGDIINTCCIHIKHKSAKTINQNFNVVYEEFHKLLDKAKERTLNYVIKNKDYKYQNKLVLDNNLDGFSVFNVLNYISKNNVKDLHIMSEKFLEFCISIKYYFQEIKITFYMFDHIENHNLIFLNYVDNVKCKNEKIKTNYESKEVIYVKKKPLFEEIKVITFGTYDLFHIGHYNLLKRAKGLGSKLIVGVSSDKLNSKKGKQSINNVEKRINDVKNTNLVDLCFVEDSLEEKNEYIKNYQADILVMGDDWRGKFDWVSCPCIYLSRTPGISTTKLKEEMKKNK